MNQRIKVEELDRKYHDRKVVLVDESDNELGIAGLIDAHRGEGQKHRAFSLQLYRKIDGKIELLLQQRASSKPVFPLYWANTCCYNLAPNEDYLSSCVRRVGEEMGIVISENELRTLYKFSYFAPDIEGWCENELDNVIVGEWSGEFKINPEEAMDAKWIKWGELNRNIQNNPEIYAPWFKMIVADPRFHSVFE